METWLLIFIVLICVIVFAILIAAYIANRKKKNSLPLITSGADNNIPSKYKLKSSEWTFNNEYDLIANGMYGDIYNVYNIKTPLVVKKQSYIPGSAEADEFMREIKALIALQHLPIVPKLIGYWIDEENSSSYLVMEKLQKIYFDDYNNVKQTQLLLDTLKILHKNGWKHGGPHPDNIMIRPDEKYNRKDISTHKYVFVDFGSATPLSKNPAEALKQKQTDYMEIPGYEQLTKKAHKFNL